MTIEPAAPFDWQAAWASTRTTLAGAVARIPRGKTIFVASGAAEPTGLVEQLVVDAAHFADNPIVHILTLGPAPYVAPGLQDRFRHNAFFIGTNVREAVRDMEEALRKARLLAKTEACLKVVADAPNAELARLVHDEGATLVTTQFEPSQLDGARLVFVASRDEDLVTRVKEITGGKLCDVVYDGVGKDTFPGSLDCIKPLGLWVSFGNSSGAVPPFAASVPVAPALTA
mgnify:CR=1 FL=1